MPALFSRAYTLVYRLSYGYVLQGQVHSKAGCTRNLCLKGFVSCAGGTSSEVSANAQAQASSSSEEEAAAPAGSRSASQAERSRQRSGVGTTQVQSSSAPATPSGALVQSQEPPGEVHRPHGSLNGAT